MKKFQIPNPTATNILIALNIVLMLTVLSVNLFNFGSLELKPETLVDFGGILPNKSSLFTIISAMFLHAGFLHISLNMLSLKSLGDEMEKFVGKQFLIIYLVSGFISGLAVYFFTASNQLTIGASGAICGLLGAKVVKTFKYHPSKLERGMIITDIAILVSIGFLPNVSAMGHLIGLISGAILGLVLFSIKEAKDGVKVVIPKDKDLELVQVYFKYLWKQKISKWKAKLNY